jgi:hypothetical protein
MRVFIYLHYDTETRARPTVKSKDKNAKGETKILIHHLSGWVMFDVSQTTVSLDWLLKYLLFKSDCAIILSSGYLVR